jgi:hypothetical protein
MEGMNVYSFPDFMKSFSKVESLSNFDIESKCKEMKINNFKGVFMRNELNRRKKTDKECLILNIDHSKNPGTHWVALFIKNDVSYYFDSYGFDPPEEVKDYCKKELYSNTFKIQLPDEVICGHYCIFMLFRLSNGSKFNDVLDELYRYNH